MHADGDSALRQTWAKLQVVFETFDNGGSGLGELLCLSKH